MKDALAVQGQFENDIKVHALAVKEYLTEDFKNYQPETAEDLEELSVIINDLKARGANLEKQEKSATQPALASVAVIRDWFRPTRQDIATVIQLCKGKVQGKLLRDAQAQHEVQRKLEAAAQKGDVAEVSTQLALLEPETAVAGLTVANLMDWEVVNIEMVPKDFLIVDSGAVDDEMSKQRKSLKRGELPVLPGIRFFFKQSIRTGKK